MRVFSAAELLSACAHAKQHKTAFVKGTDGYYFVIHAHRVTLDKEETPKSDTKTDL